MQVIYVLVDAEANRKVGNCGWQGLYFLEAYFECEVGKLGR